MHQTPRNSGTRSRHPSGIVRFQPGLPVIGTTHVRALPRGAINDVDESHIRFLERGIPRPGRRGEASSRHVGTGNPRPACAGSGFQDRRDRPLRHLSGRPAISDCSAIAPGMPSRQSGTGQPLYSAAGAAGAGASSKTVGTASSRASSANQWRTVGTRWRTLSRKVSARNRAMNRTAKALAAGVIRSSLSYNGQRLGRSLRGSPGPA